MNRRTTSAALLFIAAVAGLVAWMLTAKPERDENLKAPGERVTRPALTSVIPPAPANPAEETRRRLEEAPPVDLDFHDSPLTAIMDELVRQSGIRVTADFTHEQDRQRVTLQMNAPPFHVLQYLAKEYHMELLYKDDGWWLQALDAVQTVCYRIHELGGESDTLRVEQLVENLKKLAGNADGVSVIADESGIRLTASREVQALAAQFLESAFRRPIAAEHESVPAAPQ